MLGLADRYRLDNGDDDYPPLIFYVSSRRERGYILKIPMMIGLICRILRLMKMGTSG
jgi:hypothetical protein